MAATKKRSKPAAKKRTAAKPAKPKPRRARPSPRAVIALADDPRTSDAAIAAAIAAMTEKGRHGVAAKWAARIAAGDQALVMRLLAMFELTALTATDAAALAPFIDPLREAGNQPEVFAHLEHAMASERPTVREAVCASWLADARAQSRFDARQIDKLVRCALAIAETGAGPDARAAIDALSRITHAGARQALSEAIRLPRIARDPKLLAALYAGLAAIGGPDAVAILIERLFEERVAYGGVASAAAAAIDNAAHRRVLAALAARAHDRDAIRAATLYADTVSVRGRAGGRLVELARTVLAWPATTNDDARRLRHLFELAVIAALSVGREADARTFLARAKELPDSPLSDYHVHALDRRTPALLDDPRVGRLS